MNFGPLHRTRLFNSLRRGKRKDTKLWELSFQLVPLKRQTFGKSTTGNIYWISRFSHDFNIPRLLNTKLDDLIYWNSTAKLEANFKAILGLFTQYVPGIEYHLIFHAAKVTGLRGFEHSKRFCVFESIAIKNRP